MHVMIGRVLALILLCIVAPIFVLVGLVILIDSGWPIFFWQKRMGKDKKPFWIWKFRTMVKNAPQLQSKYSKLNEADGPVFKIRNDPRYTRFGKWLSWSGLDELPQLINVLKGEMALVGPRPLPIKEALKVPQKYTKRFEVLPGITSSWVASGAHNLSFKEWMELDLEYIKEQKLLNDIKIIAKTILVIFKTLFLNWNRFVVFLLIILGGILRYSRIVRETFWNDEVFYLSVARGNNLVDLLTTNHWIIDHPPLYLIFMHFWSMISTHYLWLRIPNLLFYLVSSIVLLRISEKIFQSKWTNVVMVGIFALFPYFVGLDWQAIPYSLAITFFLLCFNAYLQIPDIHRGEQAWPIAAIFLALFFYTSFEAAYFAGTIFIYNLLTFSRYGKLIQLRYLKMYGLALAVVLPELLILVKQFPSFPSLSGHWQGWRWGATSMIRDVFSVKRHLSMILSATIIPLLYASMQMLRSENLYRRNVLLLLSILLGFGGFLSLVSNTFFYASHPKAYYYFLIVGFLFVLTCLEWGMKKSKKITLLILFAFLQTSIWWFYPDKKFILAHYQYVFDSPEPILIRESISRLIEEYPGIKLVTDMELQEGKWNESYYLNYYYLNCLDLAERLDCDSIAKARTTEDELETSETRIVGILYDEVAKAKFEHYVCFRINTCYIWSFDQDEFVKIK